MAELFEQPPLYMSDLLHLSSPPSHTDIPFLNVRLDRDTKMFFDPWLAETQQTHWAREMHYVTKSFFDKLFTLYREQSSDVEKLALFEHIHEQNATRLGYGSTGTNGHAKTAQGMLTTLSPISALFAHDVKLSHAGDISLLIRDFNIDCLSDLITNISLRILNDFTVQICEQYHIPLSPIPKDYFFWNPHTSNWEELHGHGLLYQKKLILFSPKELVRNCYSFNPSNYFSKIISVRLQDATSWISSDGKQQRFSKKEIKAQYNHQTSNKDFATQCTCDFPSDLSQYHIFLNDNYAQKKLTDADFDNRIYGELENNTLA